MLRSYCETYSMDQELNSIVYPCNCYIPVHFVDIGKYFICVHLKSVQHFYTQNDLFYSIQEVEICKNSGPNKETMQYIINT